MRKLILLLTCAAGLHAQAQIQLQNGNFESWYTANNTTSLIPAKWNNRGIDNNTASFYSVFPYQKRSGMDGGSSLRLTNYVIATIPDSIWGGMAVSWVIYPPIMKLPALLKGHVKYHQEAGQRASISVGYYWTSNDTTFYRAIGRKTFTGTDSSSFKPFSINIDNSFYKKRESETLAVWIDNSSIFKPNNQLDLTSFIEVDNFSFEGTQPDPVVHASASVADFDTAKWYTINDGNATLPANWYIDGMYENASNVYQSNDAHTGTKALGLTIDPTSLPVLLYTLFKPSAGQSFLHFHSKANLNPSDTIVILIGKYTDKDGLADEPIDSMIFTSANATGSYTAYSLSWLGKASPSDTLALFIFAYNPIQFDNFRLAAAGQFLIDDITLGAQPLAAEDGLIAHEKVSIHPNPSATGIFFLDEKTLVARVLNSTGLTVEGVVSAGKIDLSAQPKGIYFAQITTSQGLKTVRLVY
jgi:hypothetical protein